MAISGHRNESSLKSYHSMPSANQLRKCSDVLASALGDNETIRAAEQRQNQIVGCERPPLQQLPVPLNNTISATQQNTVNTSSAYRQMFNSCTIQTVHITFNRWKDAARDLQAFLVFSQHPKWVYYTSKPIQNAVYCFYEITRKKDKALSSEGMFLMVIKLRLLLTIIMWRVLTNHDKRCNKRYNKPLRMGIEERISRRG